MRQFCVFTSVVHMTMLLTVSVKAEILDFVALMDESQAGFQCAGTGSAGSGVGLFTLDTETMQVEYHITYTSLDSEETSAHVHGSASVCEFGSVIEPLPLGSPKIGTYDLTIGQVNDMIAGLHYTNVHTVTSPDDEIRGQIQLVTGTVPAASEWGMVVMLLMIVTAGAIRFGIRPSAN